MPLTPDGTPGVPASPLYRAEWHGGLLAAECRPNHWATPGWFAWFPGTPPVPVPPAAEPGAPEPPAPPVPCPHEHTDGTACGGLCGIHLGRWLPDTSRYRMHLLSAPGLLVFGRAEGWGRVVVHRLGWRVGYARIRALVAPVRPSRRLAEAARAPREDLMLVAELIAGIADRLDARVITVDVSRGPLRDAWVATVASARRTGLIGPAEDPPVGTSR